MKLRPAYMYHHAAITPSFVSVGAFDGDTGITRPGYPAGLRANDLILLLAENLGDDAALPTPTGFTVVSNSPQVDTGGVSTGTTRLQVFYKRATGSETGTISLPASTDHIGAQMAAFRNVVNIGNPWDVTAGGIGVGTQTALTLPGLTTGQANCLIVNCVGCGADIAANTTEFTSWTNASLASITEAIDSGDSDGAGTCLGMAYGLKVAAGVVSSTTVTGTHNERHAYLTIALAPP